MTGGERILVVEDERAQREAIATYLGRRGYQVTAVASGETAMARLAAEPSTVLITDLRLPGIDGLELVRRAREIDEEMGVLLMTAFASVESAVEALRVGAHDYLLKPLILEEVSSKVHGLVMHRDLVRENARLRQALQEHSGDIELVATSGAMQAVLAWVRRAATSTSPVLITGEPGSGKEVVARAIHRLWAADAPFVAANLAAIPPEAMEAALFGGDRGEGERAEPRRAGLLSAAAGGTLFLDGITTLERTVQAKLLRTLETGELRPPGGGRPAPVEARIIASTAEDLEALIPDGRFREDLFYRLAVARLRVPPLRERPEDIPALVRQLLQRHRRRDGKMLPTVSAEAMRGLCRHPWRGNVRELSNVLERALLFADLDRIDLEDLPEDVRDAGTTGFDLQEAVARFERAHVAMVLRLCGGNREKAAEELGVSPATLYRRLERLGLKGYEVRRS